MEKVKLTQQQADSLEHFLKLHESKYEMIYAMHTDPEPWRSPLDALTGEQITNALYYGYEVEVTPEGRVANMLVVAKEQEEMLGDHPEAPYWRGKQKGILETLCALNIKIKGVNDHENN